MTQHESTLDAAGMLELLEEAVPEIDRLIDGINGARWAAPTPCEDMDVLGLVEHVVGGLEQFAAIPTGADGALGEVTLTPEAALDAFRAASNRMVSRWAGAGAADRSYAMPWGETPGTMLLGFMVLEELTHGWDLARATGQVAGFSDELAARTLELARGYDDATIRVPGMFGPAVPVADDASALDRLAAFLGRDPAAWPAVELVDLEPQAMVAVRGEVPIEGLTSFFADAFTTAEKAIARAGVEVTGPPLAFYPSMPTDAVTVEAGFTTSGPVVTDGDVHRVDLPGGRAAVTVHVGPYDAMEATYGRLEAWMAGCGLRPGPAMWECYLSDSASEPDPARWRTRIVWPIRDVADTER
ncbi:MAG: TIGR03086 family metal-binding protein [Actinomycetota bacterium]|nr:TIGR03086 family metal-binding protein [Actinomycetota bacterium]